MTPILGILLATSFVASLVALGILVWAVANKLIFVGKNEAETIFMKGELGQPDDSASFGGGRTKHRRIALTFYVRALTAVVGGRCCFWSRSGLPGC